jgi:hypothetical protein
MSAISSKLRKWVDPATGREGLTYWCQGCAGPHSICTKGASAWGWNGDVDRPIFTPSVKVTYPAVPDAEEKFKEWRTERICHTFVGCNGAKPGEVIFLGDCTHALAGAVQPLPDLPAYLRDQP